MNVQQSRLAVYLQENTLEKKGFSYVREMGTTLSFFDAVQRRAGISGNVGEIGVAQGGFFVPLLLCCNENELAVAIDVFDNLSLNWDTEGGGSALKAFKKSIVDTVGSDDQVRYIQGDSFFLGADEILRHSDGTRFRIFGVDGAHSSHHTVNDLHLASRVVVPGGLVSLDDIKNWGWPGVIDGFARYMLLNDHHRLVPFFLYKNKVLMTTPSHYKFYLDQTLELLKFYGKPFGKGGLRISEFFGYGVVGWNA
jgi:hypothetical protein